MIYPPTRAFQCKFSGRFVATPEEALHADLDSACALINSLSGKGLAMEIKKLLDNNDDYNDYHRAILFLGELVQKKAFDIANKLKQT